MCSTVSPAPRQTDLSQRNSTVGHKSAGLAMVNLHQEKVLRRLGRFPLEFYMIEIREDWKKRRWKVGKN